MICRNHVDVEEGVRLCARCRMPYCGDCLVTIHGEPYCAVCKTEKLLDIQSGANAAELPLASIGRRFAAIFIDRMLFGVVLVAIIISLVFVLARAKGDEESNVFAFVGAALVAYLGLIAYEALMLAARGQTLGKMAMKIKVVRPDGTTISTGQAWGRALLRSIMVSLLFLLNYIPAFVTKDKTCLHDLVANTRVVTID